MSSASIGSVVDPWPGPPASRLLATTEVVVPLVGAGISSGAGLPSGREFCERLVALFPRPIASTNDPRRAIESLQRAGVPIGDLHAAVPHILDLGEVADWAPSRELEALVQVPSRLIVTLNYDLALEATAGALAIPYKSFGPLDLGELWRDIVDRDPGIPLLIGHIHGSIERPDLLVAGTMSYGSLASTAAEFVNNVLQRFNVVLVGLSLDEDPILSTMSRWAARHPRHVFVASAGTVAKLFEPGGRLESGENLYGVVPVALPPPGYDHLAPFLERLVSQPRPASTIAADEPRAQLRALRLDQPHVAVPMAMAADDRDREQLMWSVSFGTADLISEESVVDRSRVLVVGPGGSGKSELLKSLGVTVALPRTAVLIPVGSLRRPFGGEPERLLSRWAASGYVFRDADEPVGEETLARRAFQFLFDGLDELPPEDRDRFVQTLAEIARRYPQHRFTVASRPVGALEELAGEWERVELLPELGWADRYLGSCGLTQDELIAAAPGVADLREIMSVPFFLAGIVQLHRGGRLGDLRGHGDLLAELLDAALEEASAVLGSEAPRGWLRRMALSMQMAGRTTVLREEALAIDLDAAHEGVIGPDEVIEALVNRSLFIEAGGTLRFSHRLLADQLTAEALLELGPKPNLVDAIAPSTAGMSGVRTGWLIPATLVMQAHPAWREAIRHRDALAAACATPAEASEDERRSAAMLIWETYQRWRIWLHNHDTPRIARASVALARLLADPALADVAASVRPSLKDPEPVVRASAVEVLMDARAPGFENDLRVILADDHEEGVVRRWAARAASELGLASLYELVRQRALEPGDQFEAQDMIVLALDLVPEEQLYQLAEDLGVRHPAEQWRIEHTARSRGGSPEAGLALRRRWVAAKVDADLEGREVAELVKEIEAPGEAALIDAGYLIAAVGYSAGSLLGAVVAQHPAETLRGMIAAIRDGVADPFDIINVLHNIPAEVLEAEGAPDRLIETRKSWDTPRVLPAPPASSASPARSPVTVAELLSRRDASADGELKARALQLSRRGGIEGADRDDLRRRLADWWPAEGVGAGIRILGDSRYSMRPDANAWVHYGPVADAPLAPHQWVDMATIPLPHSDGYRDWLRRAYTDEAGALCASRDLVLTARQWADLILAIPPPVPAELLQRLEATGPSDRDAHDVAHLGDTLAAGEQVRTLRELSSKDVELQAALIPHLARAGDIEAQTQLLGDLLARSRANGGRHLRLHWLEGVSDPSLLPLLFDCLDASYRMRLGEGVINDTMSSVHLAIRRLGGVEAVRHYDQMMAADDPVPGAQFLRANREAIVQDLLEAEGVALTSPLAAKLRLSLFDKEA